MTSNLRDNLFFGEALCLKIDKRIPETGSPHRKTDEPGNASRCLQPMYHPLSLGATSEHNEANGVASTTLGHLHQLDTIFLAIEPFYLPHIWLNTGLLEGLHGLKH